MNRYSRIFFSNYFNLHMKTLMLVFLIITLTNQSITAQIQIKTDSLKSELAKSTEDSIKYKLYGQIIEKYLVFNPDSAINYASEYYTLAESNKDIKNQIQGFIHKGRALYTKGENNEALDTFRKALELINNSGEKRTLPEVYAFLADIYAEIGDYVRAVEYYQKALTIFEKNDNTKGIARCNNNLGIVYYFQKDYKKALEFYKKALELGKKVEKQQGIISSLVNIGIIHFNLEEYDKALEYYDNALNKAKEQNKPQMFPNIYNNYGNLYLKTGDYSKAINYLERSLEICEKQGLKIGIVMNYTSLSKTYLKKKDFKKAIHFAKKAYNIAKQINEREIIKETSHVLSEAYKNLGNYRKAYEFHVHFKTESDNLLNQERTKNITALEYEYKYEKEKQKQKLENEKKEAIHREEIKRQKIIRNSFVGGFTLMIFLSFFIYRSYRIKNRLNIELKKKNDQISNQKEEITSQRDELALQKKEITDSINYAQKIQQAVLPSEKLLSSFFSDYFILMKPYGIVSGDFYWVKKIDNYLIIVVADCTGHGVPGAFMSMLGIAYLNEIIRSQEIKKASGILEILREDIKNSLGQGGSSNEARDGMDLALCLINMENLKAQYAGAYNPLYLFRKGKFKEYKATKSPIGVSNKEKPFENNEIQFYPDDTIYMFTDGYTDQIGGEKKKKFMVSNFKNLLMENHLKPMKQQKKILNDTIEKWKGKKDQLDDIMVLGIKIP